MKKSKMLISLVLIITILSLSIQSLAVNFDLNVKFDGKNIRMESENTDMSWTLDNFLPGKSDTSSITIRNSGDKPATVETSINITENDGLLDKIDLTVTNKSGEIVYTGSYTNLTTISKNLNVGETETYTVVTKLNVNAGNEYQNKTYKLNFSFKAIGEIPYGKVTVKYVDENGTELETSTVDTKKITADPMELSKEGKEFTGYRFNKVDGNFEEKNDKIYASYTEGEGSTVTYHYNKVKYGKLVVKHIKDDTQEVFKQSEDIKEEGTKYKLDPAGEAPEGYRLSHIEGKVEGEYTNKITTVIFHYSKIKYGKLIVKYVDKQDKILAQEEETKEVGKTSTLNSVGKEIPGYVFESVTGDFEKLEDGKLKVTFKEEDTVVKYIYGVKQDPITKTGRLIVKYVDQNDKVLEQQITTKEVGTEYSLETVGKKIEGYTFVEVKGECKGKYKEEDTVVIYKYKKVISGKVIILYVDEDGKELERQEITGIVSEKYKFTEEEIKKDIPGYELKKIDGELSGEYKEEDTIIYCRYQRTRKGKLIVYCVDENNEIIKKTVTTEIVGTEYKLKNVGEEIEGYDFVGIEGDTEGKYKIEDTVVKYRYKHKKEEKPSTEEVKLPQTGQFIYIYIIIIAIILGLIFLLLLLKRRKKDEEEEK